ncbi:MULTISPECIES: MarR family winged helix-turn-helix transcriptional regulator [unclassified Bacillus (in: firmicutes)]|uniref:MarR family winged helix-turn-helix transcriptional regulator n=1 Tax=unclassified Bacillus (in: firmicutes) TaxID=185979 RepID=UPI000BF20D52|nr:MULTISPECIES: MarR family transcriptional regulator [unclassified Bacillus (in: firmicutes)]PEJ59907.1 MarR family transcriptional regulator [Bacillus sp. AFS002410]PEL06723.1 MarR family transcriptional regulator [Bacillus sp. AFS017336]
MVERAEFIRESIDFLQRFLMKSLQKHSEEHGVTIPQARVIGEVYAHKTMSIKQLSKNLKMTQSTVSDIVERLTTKGLLLKTPNPNDKRSVEISLPEGIADEINGSISEIANKSINSALGLLETSDQEIVEQGLKLLVTAVKKKMESDGMDNYEFFDVLYFLDEEKGKKDR